MKRGRSIIVIDGMPWSEKQLKEGACPPMEKEDRWGKITASLIIVGVAIGLFWLGCWIASMIF